MLARLRAIFSTDAFSSIKVRFAGLVVGAALVSCAAVGVLSYQIGKSGLIDASRLRLDMIADNQASTLSNEVERIDQALSDIANNNAFGDALQSITTVLLDAEREDIQANFKTPDKSLDERVDFDGSGLKLMYAVQFSKIHSSLRNAWKNTGVSDIYILNNDGEVIFSATKGRELLTNVSDAGNEPLAEAFQRVKDGDPAEEQILGFTPYENGDGATSVFIARPLMHSNWGMVEQVGTVIMRISDNAIGSLMTPKGIGDTIDEAFLVSDTGAFRTGVAHDGLKQSIPAPLADAAKSGSTDSVFATVGDRDMFYSFMPVSLFGQKHLLVIGQSEGTILASANTLAWMAFLTTIAVVVVMCVAGYFISARMTKPLIDLVGLMNRLTKGDKSIEIASTGRRDEIGAMARALESFRDNALEKDRMEADAEKRDRQLAEERQSRDAEKERNARELEAAVSALGTGLTNLANGRLDWRIDEPFVESLDELRLNFNRSMEQLEATMKVIRSSANSIHGGASSLRESSKNLSERTERQAATLEESAAALAEITKSVNAALERCNTAVSVATDTRNNTEKSSKVVRDAIEAMKRIEESSGEIRSIIDLIDQIAFQTNLLALNAGVEAARAGEAGKGFAVVAEEVRELAQRSANAAKEINQLILRSAQDVENGVSLVNSTGESLGEIESNIAVMDEHINAIAASSRDQATRLGEISASVDELDRFTQQNAAMVEETTASAFTLSNDADELNEQVGHFSIGEGRTQVERDAA
ncbi:MAG: methyl-accepting chemotaxis protein [Oricola sp.]